MKSRQWAVIGLMQVMAIASVAAQDRLKTTTLSSGGNAVFADPDSWMNDVPEAELIQWLGLDPVDVNPPATAMRIRIDDDTTPDDGGNGGGGGGGGGPVGTSGVLPCPSAILSQNRYGLWNQVGSSDLCFMLDETWLWIENEVQDGIYDRLANAYRDQTGPNLHGFYNIDIEIAPFTTASKRVYVWPDKHKMRLTWTLPNNHISCRANLNNWPDRDVEISTTIHMTVDIQTTDLRTNPTEVVYSYISFSNTQASNDGTLYEETFNVETEAEFNSTQKDIPVELTNWTFGDLSDALAANASTSTYDFQFDYVVAQSRLVFRLFNPTTAPPKFEWSSVTSATQAARR